MKCPGCKKIIICGYESFKISLNHKFKKLCMIEHKDDTEECPFCGYRMHIDFWQEEDVRQTDGH